MLSLARVPAGTATPYGDLRANHLSSQVVERLADWHGDPDWLRERRLEARRRYEELPVPHWERGIRGWWKTDISELRLEDIGPYTLSSRASRSAGLRGAGRSGLGGVLRQTDSTLVSEQLAGDLAAKGVIFCSLSRAARDYPALVQRHLGGLSAGNQDKLVALHDALWSGGVFLYVPSGVSVALPLQARFRLDQAQLGVFLHTLLVAEPGSQVTYLEDYSSSEFEGQGLHSGIVEVYAKEGADVHFVTMHNWADSVFNFSAKRVIIERDARVHWVAGFLGGGLTRASIDSHLVGPGAELESVGIFFGSDRQHLDLSSRTYHEAPHTNADVLYKGVVKDAARASLEGLIRVERGAQQTASYLSDHTLQLSREAKSDSIPSLEIEANDVRVSHGASVGMIDEEQLFYSMARGLPRAVAERMIVTGFFEPALRRVAVEAARRELLTSIERKMGGIGG